MQRNNNEVSEICQAAPCSWRSGHPLSCSARTGQLPGFPEKLSIGKATHLLIDSLKQPVLFLEFLVRGLRQSIQSTGSAAEGVEVGVDLQTKPISKSVGQLTTKGTRAK